MPRSQIRTCPTSNKTSFHARQRRPIDSIATFPLSPFLLFNFSHIVLLTVSLLHTPTDRSRGYLELSGSGSKEELQAGSYTGRPDSCAGKSRQLVCVEDINNVEQHARGNKEGRVEADSVLGNAGMESSKLFVGL